MTRAVLLAILLMFSASSYSAPTMVARDAAGNTVSLQDEKCVASPWLTGWKTAVFVYRGQTYASCWRIQDGEVVVLDSDVAVTMLPMGIFKPETGV